MDNGNELAYPLAVVLPNGDMQISYGLTKREAFAMAAMQGLAMRAAAHEVAANAARLADALLAELEKKP